ncbi:hypothetical protein TRICI_006533 [Trichomonascus ciferrii]|uniref:Cystathionine gamma-synthase n=1 Tax=Trichomonascus ciferrii TaxID=44093 RepID=A0A642UKM8_9ASCO|nr:hypothetical protein TRICI_006533 [Trichomonascus ciferrii]
MGKQGYEYGRASLGVHADDNLSTTRDVAAPINVSTTYKYESDPEKLGTPNLKEDYYSRISQPNSRRAEEVLSKLLDGNAVVYSSGLSAFHAAMLYYNPKRVFIGDGYHGCHSVLEILKRNYNLEVLPLNSDPAKIQKGDVIHLETPVNPTGLAFDIEYFARIAHSQDAYLVVDATFAPPPLSQPFNHGADMVMHSATKYFGGHSDMLAGVLVTKDQEVKEKLLNDRHYMGTICASLESWLLLRSLRTYDLRVRAQQQSALKVIKFLTENKDNLPALDKIYHSSLQVEEFVKRQLPTGGSPVFSIELKTKDLAKTFPSKLNLFHHATSLGGAESLIEWRKLSDEKVSDRLLRVSIGVENAEDLIEDLRQALNKV